MADEKPDEEKVFVPPQKTQIKTLIRDYDDLNDKKKALADEQKVLLDEFNRAHSVPPAVVKFVRKLDAMDEPERTNAARATLHAMQALSLGNQRDMFADKAKPKPEPEVEQAKKTKEPA